MGSYPYWHPWIIATSHCSTHASSTATPSERSITPHHFLIWIHCLPSSITLHWLCDFLFASCSGWAVTQRCSFNISCKEFNLRLWYSIIWHTLKPWQCHASQGLLIINGIYVPNLYNQKQNEMSYKNPNDASSWELVLDESIIVNRVKLRMNDYNVFCLHTNTQSLMRHDRILIHFTGAGNYQVNNTF